jgi:DnaJ-domain-containing protein 1
MLNTSIFGATRRAAPQLFNPSAKRMLFGMNMGKGNNNLYGRYIFGLILVDVLGVEKKSSQLEIKKAYLKLAKMYHPDVNSSDEAKEKFALINE